MEEKLEELWVIFKIVEIKNNRSESWKKVI